MKKPFYVNKFNVIHETNKILMDTTIYYTMYHTCKRPFILRPQP